MKTFRNVGILLLAFAISGTAHAQAVSDGEIVETVIVINQNEINAAEAALAKNPTGDVKDFAEMMKKHHTDNLEKTRKLSEKTGTAPKSSASVEALRTKGASDLSALQPLNGPEFEKAYIKAMVDGHADALAKLDTDLIPSVSDEELKEHLEATRKRVSDHLKEAQEIQTKLNKA